MLGLATKADIPKPTVGELLTLAKDLIEFDVDRIAEDYPEFDSDTINQIDSDVSGAFGYLESALTYIEEG